MALWQQLLAGALGVFILFMIFPGIKATMEKSKNAEEKHWGTVILLAAALIGFVALMVYSIQ